MDLVGFAVQSVAKIRILLQYLFQAVDQRERGPTYRSYRTVTI